MKPINWAFLSVFVLYAVALDITCGPEFDDEVDLEELRRRLFILQYPEVSQCRHRKLLVHHHHDVGFGSEIHGISVSLLYAYLTNRTLVIAEEEGWRYPTCVGEDGFDKTFSCYFEKYSSCNENHLKCEDGTQCSADLGKNKEQNSDVRVLHIRPSTLYNIIFPESINTMIPTEFQHKGLFWWRSQLVAYLFRPLPTVVKPSIIHWHTLFSETPTEKVITASIHIRHGQDKVGWLCPNCYPEAEAFPVSEYLSKILNITISGNPSSSSCLVYVASDVDSSVTELKQLSEAFNRNNPNTKILVANADLFRKMRIVDLSVNPLEEGEDRSSYTFRSKPNALNEFIQDITALSNSQYFVGTFSSNVGRLVAELGCAWGNMKLGMNSLDTTWIPMP